MRKHPKRNGYFIVIDDDRNEFSVEGPMPHDGELVPRIGQAQKRGRGVKVGGGPYDTREEAVQSWRAVSSAKLVAHVDLFSN